MSSEFQIKKTNVNNKEKLNFKLIGKQKEFSHNITNEGLNNNSLSDRKNRGNECVTISQNNTYPLNNPEPIMTYPVSVVRYSGSAVRWWLLFCRTARIR